MSVYISGLEFPKVPTVIILLPDGKVEIPSQARMAKAMPVPEHDGPLVDVLDVINAFPDEFIFTNEQARALTNYIIPSDREGTG